MRDYAKRSQSGSIPSAVDFRAMATGVGSTIEASLHTGMRRSREVSEYAKPGTNLAANGYPPRMSDAQYAPLVAVDTEDDKPFAGKPTPLRTTRPAKT